MTVRGAFFTAGIDAEIQCGEDVVSVFQRLQESCVDAFLTW